MILRPVTDEQPAEVMALRRAMQRGMLADLLGPDPDGDLIFSWTEGGHRFVVTLSEEDAAALFAEAPPLQ